MNSMPLDVFFKPLVDELNYLYFGEHLSFTDSIKLPVILCSISGDNLSVHPLVGLNKCFSSGHICRFCFVQFNDLNAVCNNVHSITRSDSSFFTDATNSLHGLQHLSPFLDITYLTFPFVFPADIMHDMLEGTLHVTVALVLKFLIYEKKIFDLVNINNIVHTYINNLSLAEIKKDHIVKMKFPFKASQMLNFIKLMPLLFSNHDFHDSSQWKLLLVSIELLNIFLSIEKVDLLYIQTLVCEHNSIIYSLTDSPKHKCKIHYLSHYPFLFDFMGSFSFYWCMRFEANHQYFKSLTRTIKQFRNLPYSLTVRNEMKFCLLHSKPISVEIIPTVSKSTKYFCYDILNSDERLCVNQFLDITICFNTECYIATKVSYGHYTFSKWHIVVVPATGIECDPTFFRIVKIICIDNIWFVLCVPLKVVFMVSMNSYLIFGNDATLKAFSIDSVMTLKQVIIFCNKFVPITSLIHSLC